MMTVYLQHRGPEMYKKYKPPCRAPVSRFAEQCALMRQELLAEQATNDRQAGVAACVEDGPGSDSGSDLSAAGDSADAEAAHRRRSGRATRAPRRLDD